MSRKTYSLSAAVIAVAASMSFSSADSAKAFAKDIAAQAEVQIDFEQSAKDLLEIVPEQPVFVSQEVVHSLPSETLEIETPNVELPAASLVELVDQIDSGQKLTDQMRCLAGAVYFESRGEPLSGQLAVAQVVINRSEDNRWPASYCGVVYQRAQFSFVRGGQMPKINTSSAAWSRAKAVARIAHDGLWESEAPDAVYFHANYVSPRWSRVKTRLAQIDTHIFYR